MRTAQAQTLQKNNPVTEMGRSCRSQMRLRIPFTLYDYQTRSLCGVNQHSAEWLLAETHTSLACWTWRLNPNSHPLELTTSGSHTALCSLSSRQVCKEQETARLYIRCLERLKDRIKNAFSIVQPLLQHYYIMRWLNIIIIYLWSIYFS